MNNQWATPIPPRPPGWVPHGQQDQQYQPQQQYIPPQQQQYPQQPYSQQGYSQQQYPSQQPFQQSQYPPPQPYQQQQYYPQQQYQQQQQQQYPPQQQYPVQQQYPPQQFSSPPPPPAFYAPPQQYGQPQQQHQHQQYPPQSGQIWQPRAGATWQMVLHDPVKLDHTIEAASIWILDIFDTTAEAVAELHRRGRKVIGYFSGGTYEDWRPDASRFPKSVMGKKLDEWEGEKWVQTSSPVVRQIMIDRIELAKSKGFDGIDPDNVDGYDNKNGLGLTKDSAIDFVKFLSREAHARGLACGLKNASDIIPRVIDDVQWVVQEQCVQYGDEEEYLPFIRQGKPVFNVEYPKGEDTDSSKCNNEKDVTGKQLQKCMKAKNMGFSTIIKNIKLDQWIQVV